MKGSSKAFVAAAAKRLWIYIPRPPQQVRSCSPTPRTNGWRKAAPRRMAGGQRGCGGAQALANRGDFVVASYQGHDERQPGSIAIVLPGERSEAYIEEGPNVIRAGTVNSASISLKSGFAGHPHAWGSAKYTFAPCGGKATGGGYGVGLEKPRGRAGDHPLRRFA